MTFDPDGWAEETPPSKAKLAEMQAEEALKARQAWVESNSLSHEAELIADILRIADDPDNRYHGTCSRARYKRFGHFPEEVVFDLFGNHSEFQRAAGLRDNRATTQYRNRRAKLKTEERIGAYFKAEIQPWVGAFDRSQDEPHLSILVGSDFHGKEVDRFALEVFIDTAKRIQPDIICLNVDVLDFYEPTKWSRNPNRLLDLQGEIDWSVENILKPIREAAPDAQIDFFIGNHEYRLIRYLADTAPALASLRCLSFSELLCLKELRIGLVHNNAQLDPEGSAYKTDFKVYGDCFTVTHGRFGGQYPAAKELANQGRSGTSGHVHTPQYYAKPTDREPYADWLITPMMADRSSHGKEFIKGASTWLTGFAYFDVFPDKRAVFSQLVLQKAGIMSFGGAIYRL